MVATATTMLLAGCGDDGATTEPPEPIDDAGPDDADHAGQADDEVEDDPGGELDDEPPADTGAAGGLRSARVRDPLRNASDNFQEAEFDGGAASLAFVDDAYRMVSPGGPLVSPLQHDAMAQTVEVEVQVTVNGVDAPGFAGVACGIDDDGAYLFTAGLDETGEPFWAIGVLDAATGGPVSLRDANLDDTPSGDEVVPTDGQPFTLGGRCERGTGDQPVILTMTVDGEEIASVGGAETLPLEGQVGLFALGQSAEPFTVTFNDFLASGTPDGID